tara:strand:- start:60 stop:185 length:126 start_codon:yes stop_codon:yes gene_type:complete
LENEIDDNEGEWYIDECGDTNTTQQTFGFDDNKEATSSSQY